MKFARNWKRLLPLLALIVLFGCVPAPDVTSRAPRSPAPTLGEELVGLVEPIPERPDPVRTRIEAAINHFRKRELLTTDNFWSIFHGVLGLGPDVTILNPSTGQRMKALRYMFDGGPLHGMKFTPTPYGLDVYTAPDGAQGHQDQFVAEMAQWDTPLTEPVTVAGKQYKFEDFLNQSLARARITKDSDPTSNQELSWAIVIIAQYRGTNIQWQNSRGERLRFDDLMKYELDSAVEGGSAACGGTHRLFGLTWAYHYHLMRGGKTEGVWQRVAEKTIRYRDMARRHQLADGSLSAFYLDKTPLGPKRPQLKQADGAFGSTPRPGHVPERYQRLNATGHVLEWLALALPDDELREPWVADAASALALMILDLEPEAYHAAVYHSIHGLYLYYARLYGYGSFVPKQLLVPLPPGWKTPER